MNSYHKRLQDIEYLSQCVRELKDQVDFYHAAIIKAKAVINGLNNKSTLRQALIDLPSWYPRRGIEGDEFLTPYNSPEPLF